MLSSTLSMNPTFPTHHTASIGTSLLPATPIRSSNQHAVTPNSNFKEIFDGVTSSKGQRFLDTFRRRHRANTADTDNNNSTNQKGRRKSIISRVASMRSLRAPSRNRRSIFESTNRVRAKTVSPTKMGTNDDDLSDFGYFPRRRKSLGDILGTISNKVALRRSKVIPVISATPDSIFDADNGADAEELGNGRLWVDKLLNEIPPEHQIQVMEEIGQDIEMTEEGLKVWINALLEEVPRNNLIKVNQALDDKTNNDILKAIMKHRVTELNGRMNGFKTQDCEILLDSDMESIFSEETWGSNTQTVRSRHSPPRRSASRAQSPAPTISYLEHIIRPHARLLSSLSDENPVVICPQGCNCEPLQNPDQRPVVTVCEVDPLTDDKVSDSHGRIDLKARDRSAALVIRTFEQEQTGTNSHQVPTKKLSKVKVSESQTSEVDPGPLFHHQDLDLPFYQGPDANNKNNQQIGLETNATWRFHNERVSRSIKLTVQRMTKNFHSETCSDDLINAELDLEDGNCKGWVYGLEKTTNSDKISSYSKLQVPAYQQKELFVSSCPVKVIFPKTVNLQSHTQTYNSRLEAINAVYNYKLGDLSNFCVWNQNKKALYAYSLEDPVPNPADLKSMGLVLLWLPTPQNASPDAVRHDETVFSNTDAVEDFNDSAFDVFSSDEEQRSLDGTVHTRNVVGKDPSGFEDDFCLVAPPNRDILPRLSHYQRRFDDDIVDFVASDYSPVLIDPRTARRYLGSDYSGAPSLDASMFEIAVEDRSRSHLKPKELLPYPDDSFDSVMDHLEVIEQQTAVQRYRNLGEIGGLFGKGKPQTNQLLNHFHMVIQDSGQVIRFFGTTSSANAGIEISHIEDASLCRDFDCATPKHPKDLEHQKCIKCSLSSDKTQASIAGSISKLDNHPEEAGNLTPPSEVFQNGFVAQSPSTSRWNWVPYGAMSDAEDDNKLNLDGISGSATNLEAGYRWKHGGSDTSAATITTEFNQDIECNKFCQSLNISSYDSDGYDNRAERGVNYRSISDSSVSEQDLSARCFWSSVVSLNSFPSGFKFTAHAAQLIDDHDVDGARRNSTSSRFKGTGFEGEKSDFSKSQRPDYINLDFEVSESLREAEIKGKQVSDIESFEHAINPLEALRIVTPEQLNIRFIGKAARHSPLGRGKVGALVDILQARGLMPQSLKKSIIRTGSPSSLLHQAVVGSSGSSLKSTPPRSMTSSRPMSRMSDTKADDNISFGELLEKCEKHDVKEHNAKCKYEEEFNS